MGRRAVTVTPPGHPHRAARLSSLGNALRTSYQRTGALADLNAAIDTHRQAVDAAQPHQARPAAMLSNLAGALMTRYERTKSESDLDAALEAARTATTSGREGRAGHRDFPAKSRARPVYGRRAHRESGYVG